jgi:hypothetical protein
MGVVREQDFPGSLQNGVRQNKEPSGIPTLAARVVEYPMVGKSDCRNSFHSLIFFYRSGSVLSELIRRTNKKRMKTGHSLAVFVDVYQASGKAISV